MLLSVAAYENVCALIYVHTAIWNDIDASHNKSYAV